MSKENGQRAIEEGTNILLWPLPAHICAHMHIPYTGAHHMQTKIWKTVHTMGNRTTCPTKEAARLSGPLCSLAVAVEKAGREVSEITHTLFTDAPGLSWSPSASPCCAPPLCTHGVHRNRQNPEGQIAPALERSHQCFLWLFKESVLSALTHQLPAAKAEA